MKTATTRGRVKPFILTLAHEEILRAVYFFRFVTAKDVSRLLYSPSSLTYVRSILSALAGGEDFKNAQYLFRFPLPNTSIGGSERIYTLGSKGRDYLANELGLPVDFYFRPHKVRHLSYSHVLHNLTLTRFLVAASAWSDTQPDIRISQTRICYELTKTPARVEITKEGKREVFKVIPDAWLLFEKLKNGEHQHWFPVLLEVDRGTEYKKKFIQHVRSRLEFIKKGGAYSRLFGTDAVTIAYVTTGERPEYREARRKAMCVWTSDLLKEFGKESWGVIFRFYSLDVEDIYKAHIFESPVWYRPDQATSVPLFIP